MESAAERRRENRIRFSWPAWYGHEENGEFQQGQIVDLSQSSVALTIASELSPEIGDHVLTRFSYPLNGSYDFQMGTYYQWAEVIRLASTSTGQTHVALRLAQPLSQDPSQSSESEQLLQTA